MGGKPGSPREGGDDDSKITNQIDCRAISGTARWAKYRERGKETSANQGETIS